MQQETCRHQESTKVYEICFWDAVPVQLCSKRRGGKCGGIFMATHTVKEECNVNMRRSGRATLPHERTEDMGMFVLGS